MVIYAERLKVQVQVMAMNLETALPRELEASRACPRPRFPLLGFSTRTYFGTGSGAPELTQSAFFASHAFRAPLPRGTREGEEAPPASPFAPLTHLLRLPLPLRPPATDAGRPATARFPSALTPPSRQSMVAVAAAARFAPSWRSLPRSVTGRRRRLRTSSRENKKGSPNVLPGNALGKSTGASMVRLSRAPVRLGTWAACMDTLTAQTE